MPTAASCATTCTGPSGDAIRRDFTANALYYAIEDFSVRDYTGGFADVEVRVRLISDPEARYREDPVRMLPRRRRFNSQARFQHRPGHRRADQTWHLLASAPASVVQET